jgi:hypothetical protein
MEASLITEIRHVGTSDFSHEGGICLFKSPTAFCFPFRFLFYRKVV